MGDDSSSIDGGAGGGAGTGAIRLVAPGDDNRLDRALAAIAPEGVSRSRLTALIRDGAVFRDGRAVTDPKAKVKAGETYVLTVPAAEDAAPAAEAIPLSIIHEDAHLIVVDKPVGMVVHPAPGAPSGTLVNALLHHCGDSLSGIGGVKRPGIVHRIDKDTSGLLVVAKTDLAHQGLSALFAAHDLTRDYLAVTRGAPDRADPRLMGAPGVTMDGPWFRVETQIGRHPADRKKMAVRRGGDGRRAVTRFQVEEKLSARAALIRCRLETGRTHQIRVHLNHLGHGLVGDQVYGRGKIAGLPQAAATFPRQALHAATLGFSHPASGEEMLFSAPLPPDLLDLVDELTEK
ncbi:MAG: RluA family pseudouridine synthase [Pseudomonadota bacterium]